MTQKPSEPPKPEENADEASEGAEPKKERVLHTRIPAVLEGELKSAARALRIPVSNLVRTILEDAVSIQLWDPAASSQKPPRLASFHSP